jgi:hypothetical protein
MGIDMQTIIRSLSYVNACVLSLGILNSTGITQVSF